MNEARGVSVKFVYRNMRDAVTIKNVAQGNGITQGDKT